MEEAPRVAPEGRKFPLRAVVSIAIILVFLIILVCIAVPTTKGTGGGNPHAMTREWMRLFCVHQEIFRSTDADGNGAKDYWTADVAGFYALEYPDGGSMMKYIDVAHAKADVKPRKEAYSWQPPLEPEPCAGYLCKVIERDADGKPYCRDDDGDGKSYTNPSKYAVCTFPAEYGKDGIYTFIVDEKKVIYRKDTGGAPVEQWPAGDLIEQGWEGVE